MRPFLKPHVSGRFVCDTPAEEGEVPWPEIKRHPPAPLIVPKMLLHVAHKLPATQQHAAATSSWVSKSASQPHKQEHARRRNIHRCGGMSILYKQAVIGFTSNAGKQLFRSAHSAHVHTSLPVHSYPVRGSQQQLPALRNHNKQHGRCMQIVGSS